MFLAHKGHFGTKNAMFLVEQKYFLESQYLGLFQSVILSYHMPLYLNVYGQARQKCQFWLKTSCFCPKWLFFGPKAFLKKGYVQPKWKFFIFCSVGNYSELFKAYFKAQRMRRQLAESWLVSSVHYGRKRLKNGCLTEPKKLFFSLAMI